MFGKRNKTLKSNEVARMEKLAQEFNYHGDENYYGDDTNYIGHSDFEFPGTESQQPTFAREYDSSKIYTFTLANTNATDQNIVLCPAYFDTVARLQANGFPNVSGILQDGVVVAGVTATAQDSTKSIYSLLNFIKLNPTRVTGITIQSNVQTQFDKVIRYSQVSPVRNLGERTINLTEYFDVRQFQNNKVDVNLMARDEVLHFDDQTVIVLTVAANSSLTINLKLGATSNGASNLAKKAKTAHRNLKARINQRMRG